MKIRKVEAERYMRKEREREREMTKLAIDFLFSRFLKRAQKKYKRTFKTRIHPLISSLASSGFRVFGT
jgi:hypothetical protein